MSKNSSIPAKTLPEGATEAAVIQTLTEHPEYINDFFKSFSKEDGSGPTLRDYADYCVKSRNAGEDPQVQILQDYLKNNSQAGDYEILNVTWTEGQGTKILVRGDQAGSNRYYVGFKGTSSDEWIDNGEGMTQTVTLQQQDAARYFDTMVEENHITDQDTVIVTGHSKGGNKAQYVTMASEHADLVDSCIALDGQGFSPEAVEQWKQYPDVYESRRQKITLIAGENDYVHILGERIATDENTYYVAYDSSYAKRKGLDTGELFGSYHYNHYLFQTVWDGERYVFSSKLQTPSVQGPLSQQLQDINDYLMSLPPEERLSASVTFMSIATIVAEGKSIDGYTPSLADIISTLNTLYELLDYKLGVWDDAMMLWFAPRTYRTLEKIHAVIRGLENIRNQWEQYRAERAQAKAKSLAQGDPYIYIDTVSWNELGIRLRRLGNVDYSAVRRRLVDIRNELDKIFCSVANVISAAGDVLESANRTVYELSQTISSLMEGDIIESVSHAINAAQSALDTAKAVVNLATTLIREAQRVANSIGAAISRIVSAISLIGVEDTVRELGGFLADTAQNFQMAEAQNITLIRQWGG